MKSYLRSSLGDTHSDLGNDSMVMDTFLKNPANTAVLTTAEFYSVWKAKNREISCSLTAHPVKMSRQAGLAMRKGFPAKPIIDYHLLKLREKGTLSRIQKSWLPNGDQTNDICKEKANDDFEASFQDVKFIFIVVAIGCSLAMILSFLEKNADCLTS